MEQPRAGAGVSQEPLVLVLTTEANQEKAESLAEALLQKGLVACVSIMPIVSLYQWEGQLTRSEEVQLLLKTHQACLEELHPTLMTLHSYETPEWITVHAHTQGAYAQWCAEQLNGSAFKEDGVPQARARSSGDEGPAG